MATRIEEILGRDINSLKELREEIKRLQDSIANVDPATENFKDTTTKLIAAQEQLTSVTRAGKDANVAASDSIVGMEREYKALYNTYKMLTEEQRNSDFGKNMAESLNNLSNKLNDTKKNVGNFKDNIGRYSESVIDAFSKMGGSVGGLVGPFATATKGVQAFNTALKANPVGAVIALITTLISVIKSLSGGIKDNEESQMRLNQAMASFQPIIDAAKNAMDKMGQAIVKVIEFIAQVVDKIRIAKAAFTDFIGITKGAKDAVKEQQKVYKDLAASVNNLTKTKREYQKLNAADEAEVQRLREEASEATTLEEKRRLLNEAKDKQAEIDNRNIEIAKEELRILEEQSKLTANSAAENEKLAAAVAKVSQMEATAANNMRAFNKQLGSNITSTNGASTATKNYREEAKKLYEETVEWNKTELQKLTEKYEKEKKLLEKYHLDTTLLTKKYNSDVNKINEENAKKIKEDLQALNDWKTTSLNEYLNAALGNEDLASREILDLQESMADAYQQGFHIIWENTDMFDELADNFKGQFERMVEDGFDIKFPPDDFVMDSEENVQEILHYVDNYFINLKKKITRQKQEIEDKLATDRIFDKVTNSSLLSMEDELEAYYKGASNGEFLTLVAANTRETLEIQKSALEEELSDFKGTEEMKIQLTEQYYDTVMQLRERDIALAELEAERTNNAWMDSINALGTIGSSLNNISQSYETVINAKLKDGQITEEQANRQKKSLKSLEDIIKVVNIASVVGQTAAGIMGVWKAYALEKVANAETAAAAGPAAAGVLAGLNAKSLISAIAQTAGLAATGIAQVASINANAISRKSALSDAGSGGAAGTAATPMEIDSTPYTYSRTLQTAEEEDAIYNKNIWVSVTDIESGLNHKARVTDESSF